VLTNIVAINIHAFGASKCTTENIINARRTLQNHKQRISGFSTLFLLLKHQMRQRKREGEGGR
jgi:hypothetical protein